MNGLVRVVFRERLDFPAMTLGPLLGIKSHRPVTGCTELPVRLYNKVFFREIRGACESEQIIAKNLNSDRPRIFDMVIQLKTINCTHLESSCKRVKVKFRHEAIVHGIYF